MATFRELVTLLHEHPGHTAEWYAGALKMDDVGRVEKALQKLLDKGVINGDPKIQEWYGIVQAFFDKIDIESEAESLGKKT